MQSHLFFNEEACTFDEVQAIFFVYVALLAKLTLQSTLSLALSPLLLWNQNKENPQGK